MILWDVTAAKRLYLSISNPSYPILGYNIGGQTSCQPQAQMPQPSFQQVAYPSFGQ